MIIRRGCAVADVRRMIFRVGKRCTSKPTMDSMGLAGEKGRNRILYERVKLSRRVG